MVDDSWTRNVVLAGLVAWMCSGCAALGLRLEAPASPPEGVAAPSSVEPGGDVQVEGAGEKVSAGAAAAPSGRESESESAVDAETARQVERMLELADTWVGLRSLKQVSRRLTDDCTGFVRRVYAELAVTLGGTAQSMYALAQSVGAVHRGMPSPGDLVFFEETYDRNRDGRRNDGVTHVAVVERLDAQGNVVFVHRGSKGIARSRMNLGEPARHQAEDGETLNDYLRPARGRQRAYASGELFVGYASVQVLRKALAPPVDGRAAAPEPAATQQREQRVVPWPWAGPEGSGCSKG